MLFVHLVPCTMLVVLNILLFRTMKEAERKRERLLNCRQRKAAGGESKETKKLRDSNCTTLMLIVVITVRVADVPRKPILHSDIGEMKFLLMLNIGSLDIYIMIYFFERIL